MFTAAEGISPLACFHQARMDRARDLLAAGEHSVKQVAYALGYQHANDLSRAYRRRFGKPPRQGA
jgi:transcriptional regulator GlxA family with amidase domain